MWVDDISPIAVYIFNYFSQWGPSHDEELWKIKKYKCNPVSKPRVLDLFPRVQQRFSD